MSAFMDWILLHIEDGTNSKNKTYDSQGNGTMRINAGCSIAAICWLSQTSGLSFMQSMDLTKKTSLKPSKVFKKGVYEFPCSIKINS